MLLFSNPWQLELPLKNFRVALGCDPGIENFGWAIYVRGVGITHSSVMDGIDHVSYTSFFRRNLTTLFTTHKPDCMAIERYHSQPRGPKKNLELVNLTIGIALELSFRLAIPIEFVTAAVHKGWLARNYEVQFREEKTRGRIKRKYDITTYHEYTHLLTEHEADAANLAKYALEHTFI